MDYKSTTPTIYDEHKREKAERRGTGFLGFLSDLDWMLSLELEEGRPLDDSKITTAQKFFAFNQGFKFGLGIHSAVLFAMNISLYSLIWSFHLENPIWINLIFFVSVLFSLLVKIAIPIWLLEDYYVFPKGITYTYLSWFLTGYSFGIFVPELIYFISIVILATLYYVFHDINFGQWYITSMQILKKYFSHYIDYKWLPFHFAMLLLSFLPLVIKNWYKKKNPLKSYEWMPLDFIPDDKDNH